MYFLIDFQHGGREVLRKGINSCSRTNHDTKEAKSRKGSIEFFEEFRERNEECVCEEDMH